MPFKNNILDNIQNGLYNPTKNFDPNKTPIMTDGRTFGQQGVKPPYFSTGVPLDVAVGQQPPYSSTGVPLDVAVGQQPLGGSYGYDFRQPNQNKSAENPGYIQPKSGNYDYGYQGLGGQESLTQAAAEAIAPELEDPKFNQAVEESAPPTYEWSGSYSNPSGLKVPEAKKEQELPQYSPTNYPYSPIAEMSMLRMQHANALRSGDYDSANQLASELNRMDKSRGGKGGLDENKEASVIDQITNMLTGKEDKSLANTPHGWMQSAQNIMPLLQLGLQMYRQQQFLDNNAKWVQDAAAGANQAAQGTTLGQLWGK